MAVERLHQGQWKFSFHQIWCNLTQFYTVINGLLNIIRQINSIPASGDFSRLLINSEKRNAGPRNGSTKRRA